MFVNEEAEGLGSGGNSEKAFNLDKNWEVVLFESIERVIWVARLWGKPLIKCLSFLASVIMGLIRDRASSFLITYSWGSEDKENVIFLRK